MIEAVPSRTAFRVALRRAAHQLVDAQPLVFPDPFAIPILGNEASEALKNIPSTERKPFSAGMRAWMVARARFAEDTLAEAAEQQQTPLQYLVLGAGLDTFALRNPFAHVQVFEVDHPATQAWKQDCFSTAQLTMPPTARWVPVDFESQNLHQQLMAAGFSLCTRTVVAWLGVVPYLTAAAFAVTCGFLARLRQETHLIFDYGQPREVLPPVEQLMQDSLASRVAQAGEPFQLFFTPQSLHAQLLRVGFHVREDLGSVEINERYFQQRSDGLCTRGSAGRLCHALSDPQHARSPA